MASDTVVQAFWTGFRRAAAEVATNLRAGVEAANAAVRAKQQSDAALAEMGSTLVAALVLGQRLYWASMGDSGLWLFRAGQLRRLNEDHSMRPLLFDLVELGRMTREEALADPRAHHLRSAITGRDLPLVEIAADGYRLKADDVVLLASDGLEVLSEARISGLNAQRGTDARGLARALLDAVDEASGQDNLDPRQHGSARSLISAPVGRLLASVNLSLPLVETECPSLEEETRRQLAQARQEHRRTLRSASIIGGLLLIGILGTLWSKRRRLRAAEAATRRMQSALSEVSARDRLRSSAPDMFLEGTRPPVALKIPGASLVDQPGAIVGRNPSEATFVINHEQVSRRHFRLFLASGRIMIEDLGSTNGTQLNGQPAEPGQPQPLDDASHLQLGDLELRVRIGH